jgi:hypothetical protein
MYLKIKIKIREAQPFWRGDSLFIPCRFIPEIPKAFGIGTERSRHISVNQLGYEVLYSIAVSKNERAKGLLTNIVALILRI